MKYFQRHPLPSTLLTHIHPYHCHRGDYLLHPPYFFNLITQSLIFYDVLKRMNNELKHEVGKTKSSHECVDLFQLYIHELNI
jgi:hypothetical protein